MTPQNNLNLAHTSLLGLSIGDALGETFFGPAEEITARVYNRQLQEGNWHFTDDTIMAIGVYNVLSAYRTIDQDALAETFTVNYQLDNYRGYGATAQRILRDIADGMHWQAASSAVFDGMGSAGNGAAMRAGPIGAFFHDDTAAVIEQSRRAAIVTHTHTEGIAGGIAVALAACICTRYGLKKDLLSADTFYDFIIEHMPESDVKAKIQKARKLPANYDIRTIVSVLGNGVRLTAQDTVPFALWCTAQHTDSYVEAIWTGIQALGDRDTIAAIIGSIVVMSAGQASIPQAWIELTEKIDESPFIKNLHAH